MPASTLQPHPTTIGQHAHHRVGNSSPTRQNSEAIFTATNIAGLLQLVMAGPLEYEIQFISFNSRGRLCVTPGGNSQSSGSEVKDTGDEDPGKVLHVRLLPAQEGHDRGGAVPAAGEREGRPAGGAHLPPCIKKAFDNPDKYDLDIPLVELLVEAAKKTHRWRISFTPNGM